LVIVVSKSLHQMSSMQRAMSSTSTSVAPKKRAPAKRKTSDDNFDGDDDGGDDEDSEASAAPTPQSELMIDCVIERKVRGSAMRAIVDVIVATGDRRFHGEHCRRALRRAEVSAGEIWREWRASHLFACVRVIVCIAQAKNVFYLVEGSIERAVSEIAWSALCCYSRQRAQCRFRSRR
jgi:hypothetical protein